MARLDYQRLTPSMLSASFPSFLAEAVREDVQSGEFPRGGTSAAVAAGFYLQCLQRWERDESVERRPLTRSVEAAGDALRYQLLLLAERLANPCDPMHAPERHAPPSWDAMLEAIRTLDSMGVLIVADDDREGCLQQYARDIAGACGGFAPCRYCGADTRYRNPSGDAVCGAH